MTAKTVWERGISAREPVLQRARDCAALTIPSLLPPLGSTQATELPQPYQSLGARGVNNLASKLLLAMFPSGTAYFRLVVDEDVAAAAGDGAGEIQKRLAKLESKAMQSFEASRIRPHLFEALSLLVVTGNALCYFGALDDFRVYRLDHYVMTRDESGNPVECVAKECVSPSTLPVETIQACDLKGDADEDDDVDIYTHIKWERGKVSYYQEINGKIVPGSESEVPEDKSPWIPLRWKATVGEDYGRGMVEEYMGDLRSLEGLSQAIVEFSATAAKILWLVAPNSATDPEDINRAESGEAITGRKEDISALQLEKYADFQVASSVAQRLEERLSYAFLLRAGATRDAERVTAEEIRAVAQELEDTLGGVYTVQSQDFQLPLTRRLLAVLAKSNVLPRLPKGTVAPVIVTGFQALGRNHSLNRLRGLIGDLSQLFGPEAVSKVLNLSEAATRLGVGWGVEDLDSLVKSQDQMQQEQAQNQQNQMAAEMAKSAAGPVAGQMAKQAASQ